MSISTPMLKKNWLRITNLIKDREVFVYLLAAILVSIPLKFAFGSISCLIFFLISFSSLQKLKYRPNSALFLPMMLYGLMIVSLFWTRDLQSTLAGLQKEILIFIIPFTFLFIPKLTKEMVGKVFRIFSFAMVFYALIYFINAVLRYAETGNENVFFYHELVTEALSAIYVSTFASFALFYFILIKNKSGVEKAATFILAGLIFLLSSKSLISIDFLLFVCYYIFFSDTHKGVKVVTVFSVSIFLFFSFVFVPQIKERFLIEYETAFVDNTVNKKTIHNEEKIYNVSLKQAWYNDQFQPNNFFPGTALRIYQTRIFKEMLQEQHVLFTGFGFEASQQEIRRKAKQHNLFEGYGEFNFHNQYVQTFAELGIIGFCILVIMLYVNLKKAWNDMNFLHIVFSITMIMLLLSESFFCRQRGVVFFITIYCMFNTIDHRVKKSIPAVKDFD